MDEIHIQEYMTKTEKDTQTKKEKVTGNKVKTNAPVG